jgi:hypothetical protein
MFGQEANAPPTNNPPITIADAGASLRTDSRTFLMLIFNPPKVSAAFLTQMPQLIQSNPRFSTGRLTLSARQESDHQMQVTTKNDNKQTFI